MKRNILLPFAVAFAAMLTLPLTANAAAVIAKGDCGYNGTSICTWSVDANSKTLTITGSGYMEDYDYSTIDNVKQPWDKTIEIGGVGTVYLKTYIEHVVVEESVTRIGSYAFYNMPYLKDIKINTNLPMSQMGKLAMTCNPELEKVYFSDAFDIQKYDANENILEDCPKLRSISGKNVINGVLYSANKKVLICSPTASWDEKYTVIDDCEEIAMRAFDKSDYLETVTLPASIKKIGWSAFYLNSKLTDIYAHMLTLPETNTYIVLPPSPLTAKDITVHVHNDALSLYQNNGLWSQMTIVADIDPVYTGKCGDNITYSFNDNTGELTLTGTGAMYTYGSGSGTAPRAPWYDWHDGEYGPSLVKKITIGEGITSINCFWGSNSYLDGSISEVTLPSTLQVITAETFYEGRFTNIVLPDDLNYLGASAFAKSSLSSVTFGKSKPYIGNYVFENSNLKDVYVPWTEESQIPVLSASSEIFDNPATITLHVKKGAKSIYEGMDVWKDFIIVEDFGLKSGKCGENITWTYDTNDGSLVLEGTGAMYNYDLLNDGSNPAPWFVFANESPYVTSIEVGEGITEIGSMTNNPYIEELILPSTLTTIRESTFYGCVYALDKAEDQGLLVLPENLKSIGAGAFKWWLELKELVIPKSVASIGNEAFAWCDKLNDVYVFWEDASQIPAITTTTFTDKTSEKNRASSITLHVPVGFAAIYKDKDVWKDMKIVEEYYYTTPYPFYVAGVRATADNMPMDLSTLGVAGITASGTISYDEMNRILTLNNVSMEATTDFDLPLIDIIGIDDGEWYAHQYEKIIINLVGSNSLKANKQTALYVQGAVTITENVGGLLPKKAPKADVLNSLSIVGGNNPCISVTNSDFSYGSYKAPTRKAPSITYDAPYLHIEGTTVNLTSNTSCISNLLGGYCDFYEAEVKMNSNNAAPYVGSEIELIDCQLLYPANASFDDTENQYKLSSGTTHTGRLEFGTGDIVGYLVQLTVASADENMGTVNTEVSGLYDNGEKVSLVATAKEHYRFVSWSDGDTNASRELTIGTTDLTLTAQFEVIPQYVISVMAMANGSVEGAGTYEEGSEVTITATANDGYHFDHWTSNLSGDISDNPYTFTVTQAETFVAVFEQNPVITYTVTFIGFNDVVLKSESVEEGKSATAPEAPEVEGYEFKGWDKDFSNITSDLTVRAVYEQKAVEVKEYTVIFLGFNDTFLKSEKVKEGETATAPEAPEVEGYEFKGWDKDFSNVQSDLTIRAVYEEIVVIDYTPKNLKVEVLDLEGDQQITFSWDAVEGAASYEIELIYAGEKLIAFDTEGLNEITVTVSEILSLTDQLESGTYTLGWQVRSLDAESNALSDWAQGEAFEVTIDTGAGVEDINGQMASPRKVLRDNHVVIILPDGREFDAAGKKMK